MRFINAIDGLIAKLENILIIILLSLMVAVSFLQVILRNLFDTGILWADPFLRYVVLWIAFIGASLATREDRHINIDVFTRLLSPGLRKFSSVITNFFASVVCLLLLRASIDFVKMEIDFPSVVFLGLKNWMLELIIPIGFGLMSLRFLFRAVKVAFIKNIF
jgi:C4-dicarboxylate transporter DctQ subunit